MSRDMQKPILVMAGGTGGHVFPALAVAECLRAQGEQIVWLGTRAGIEARVVPAANFAIEWLNVQGLRGKGMATLLVAPFRLLRVACCAPAGRRCGFYAARVPRLCSAWAGSYLDRAA